MDNDRIKKELEAVEMLVPKSCSNIVALVKSYLSGELIRKAELLEQQRINNLVLADKCDELDKFKDNYIPKAGLPTENDIYDVIYNNHELDIYNDDDSRWTLAEAIHTRLEGGGR